MHIFFMVYKAVNLVQYSKYFGLCMRVKIGKLCKILIIHIQKRGSRKSQYYHYVHFYDILPLALFLIFRYLQRVLKKRNHALTSAAIRTHVFTEAPALSYVQTPIISSTVHAQWDFTADFVKNEEQHLAKSNYGKTKGASLECINCLTQRLRPCTRSSVMPSLKKDSFWTLIESFSRRNKNEFEDKVFFKDYRKNQEAFTWG